MQARNQQRGLTLIELMIGMVVGLITITISYQIFISNKTTHNRILAQSRLQENARFAFHFIGNSIRNTGYRTKEEELPPIAFNDVNNPIISGSDGTDMPIAGEPAPLSFSSRSVDVTIGTETFTLANVAEYSDVLVVRYEGAEADGLVTDCAGESVLEVETDDAGTAGVPGDDFERYTIYAADIIYARVAPTAADNRSRFRLHCRRERVVQAEGSAPERYENAGGNAFFQSVTLVEDVTAFQVRLGVDTTGDQEIDLYQNFSDNPSLDRVRSIEVTLDVKGGRTLDLIETASATTVSQAESLQRQYSQTFSLRNLVR